MKPFLLFVFINLSVTFAYAQPQSTVGVITDHSGEPIPFASIYQTERNVGASANGEGVFRLTLPVGKHQLVASAVGYSPTTINIEVPSTDSIRIRLNKENYVLKEVVIGNGEDPAYEIIRKAIKKRKTHLNQSGPYTAQVYIKGLQRMLKAPKKFFGVDLDKVGREMGLDSNRRGIIYLSESESEITVDPPSHFKEEMISSKVSGSNRAFSFNRASDLQLNFYENHQPIFEGLSSRPFVSPIADNAFSYYEYKYLGSSEEAGLVINKIKVIPKRKAEPLYKGDIYIIEDEWRIYSVNLLLDNESSINIVDSLNIKQLFTPLDDKVWMPANTQLDFKVDILGFNVEGYFSAIYQDYELLGDIDPKIFREALRIEEDVNKKNSDYWVDNRPIPLTEEESRDYVFKDSIRRRNESKEYLDSVDREGNKFKPLGFLTGGYSHSNRYKKEYFHFSSPITSLLYNTVEGLAINYGLSYSKEVDTTLNRYLNLSARVRYGFANERLNANATARIPVKKHDFTLSGGSDVVDLNPLQSLPFLFNTVTTLALGENYKKLYEKQFATMAWSYTFPGNIRVSSGVDWESRHWLPNATDFTLWDRNRDKLTSNNPFTPETDVPVFDDHRAFKAHLSLSYDFSNRYETYPSGRRYLPSKYPRLTVKYTKGIKEILGSDVDYDLLSASVYKSNIPLGMSGKLAFTIEAGTFLNNNQLFYPDFKHFNGNEILLVDQQLTSFLNLDYYQHSTKNSFLQAHTEYNLSGMLTSKVPLLRKLKLDEIIGLHYLHTSELNHYGEVHLGLQWKALRVMYSRSLSDQHVLDGKSAIRVGIKLF